MSELLPEALLNAILLPKFMLGDNIEKCWLTRLASGQWRILANLSVFSTSH
jgi:hypothetical protein